LDFQDVLVLSKKPSYEHFFVPFGRANDIIEEHKKVMETMQQEKNLLDAERQRLSGELFYLHDQFNEYKLFSLLKFSAKSNIKYRHPGLFKILKGKGKKTD